MRAAADKAVAAIAIFKRQLERLQIMDKRTVPRRHEQHTDVEPPPVHTGVPDV